MQAVGADTRLHDDLFPRQWFVLVLQEHSGNRRERRVCGGRDSPPWRSRRRGGNVRDLCKLLDERLCQIGRTPVQCRELADNLRRNLKAGSELLEAVRVACCGGLGELVPSLHLPRLRGSGHRIRLAVARSREKTEENRKFAPLAPQLLNDHLAPKALANATEWRRRRDRFRRR